MEAREKLLSISDGLKVLQDGRAGLVPSVKVFTCKLNFPNFNFAVQPQQRKFVDHQNFPFLRYFPEVSLGNEWTLHVDIGQSLETNKREEHCSY